MANTLQLLTILNSANIASTNNALYQILKGLIEQTGSGQPGTANAPPAVRFTNVIENNYVLPDNVFLNDGNNIVTGNNNFYGPTGINTYPLYLSSGQIQFPVVQNLSVDPNALDDYEEGTWTPILVNNSGYTNNSYSSQYGNYIKVGRLVSIGFYMALSSRDLTNGNLGIGGIPFTVQGYHAVASGYWANVSAEITSLGFFTLDSDIIYLSCCKKLGYHSNLANADITDIFALMGHISYMTRD